MSKFIFVMQHAPSVDQISAARAIGAEEIYALTPDKEESKVEGVTYYGHVRGLNVPDDPTYGRDAFLEQAASLVEVVEAGDAVQAMGQVQLANAVNALAARKGAALYESVTARESEEVLQPDGSTKKVAVFRFKGFRPVYNFS